MFVVWSLLISLAEKKLIETSAGGLGALPGRLVNPVHLLQLLSPKPQRSDKLQTFGATLIMYTRTLLFNVQKNWNPTLSISR